MSLTKLIEAVEAGAASMNDFAAVFPSETAYGPTTWGEAHKAYNGSLDAAKRLHGALLPGWMVACMCQLLEIDENRDYTGGTKDWLVNLRRLSDGHSIDSVIAETQARAWLLSILRALEEEGRDG